MIDRLNRILEERNWSVAKLARQMGWSQQKLHSRLNAKKISLDTLYSVAIGLDMEPHELLDTSDKYGHWYDEVTGEWLGIRKK